MGRKYVENLYVGRSYICRVPTIKKQNYRRSEVINLWDETIEELLDSGKTFEDVEYIQGSDFKITKENFERIAKKTVYYSGYGAAKVATDLVIVGKDWWLERREYDGLEWWGFQEKPKQMDEIKEISALAGGRWDKLDDINFPDED